jgi:hypothetical protein
VINARVGRSTPRQKGFYSPGRGLHGDLADRLPRLDARHERLARVPDGNRAWRFDGVFDRRPGVVAWLA